LSGLGVVSPVDLEHTVLRHKLSRPSSVLSGLLLPVPIKQNDSRSKLLLLRAEPLVTFALASGSVSSPGVVVFRPHSVHTQLLAAATLYLRTHVVVSTQKRSVKVPQVLDWFKADLLALPLSSSSSSSSSRGGITIGVPVLEVAPTPAALGTAANRSANPQKYLISRDSSSSTVRVAVADSAAGSDLLMMYLHACSYDLAPQEISKKFQRFCKELTAAGWQVGCVQVQDRGYRCDWRHALAQVRSGSSSAQDEGNSHLLSKGIRGRKKASEEPTVTAAGKEEEGTALPSANKGPSARARAHKQLSAALSPNKQTSKPAPAAATARRYNLRRLSTQ